MRVRMLCEEVDTQQKMLGVAGADADNLIKGQPQPHPVRHALSSIGIWGCPETSRP